jgi:hypothetical protein
VEEHGLTIVSALNDVQCHFENGYSSNARRAPSSRTSNHLKRR